MTYFRDKWQGAGAIAAHARAPRSAPGINVGALGATPGKVAFLQQQGFVAKTGGGFGTNVTPPTNVVTVDPSTIPNPTWNPHPHPPPPTGPHKAPGPWSHHGHGGSPWPQPPSPVVPQFVQTMPPDGALPPEQPITTTVYVCWDGSKTSSADACPPTPPQPMPDLTSTSSGFGAMISNIPTWGWVAGGLGLAYVLFGRKKK